MKKERIKYFDSLSDHELVDRLKADDKETIEYLFFHRCNGMFAHVIHSVFHDQGKKEELITEFYLFLRQNKWYCLREFKYKASLNTYLTTIAVRYFKKKRASQAKLEVLDPLLIVETRGNDPDDFDMLREYSKLEIYKAINRLSKPRERVAILEKLAGKSASEIAKDLGCTVMAVYDLLKKAKEELKKLLKDKEI